jgi:hypothetical protein
VTRDPRDEALNKIQDIANNLLAGRDLPAELRHDIELIETLARHRDISGILDIRYNEGSSEQLESHE